MAARLRPTGFSLIELMIVVAIISILASIALPLYRYYTLRTKSMEAQTILGSIRVSQTSHVGGTDNYANVTSTEPPTLGGETKQAWPHLPCPATCSELTPQNCTTFECLGFAPSANVYYQYAAPHRRAVGVTTAEFGAGAVADLDADGSNGSFAYRSNNDPTNTANLGVVNDGITNCPGPIPAQEIFNCALVVF